MKTRTEAKAVAFDGIFEVLAGFTVMTMVLTSVLMTLLAGY